MAMTLHGGADDFVLGDIEGGEESGCAVPALQSWVIVPARLFLMMSERMHTDGGVSRIFVSAARRPQQRRKFPAGPPSRLGSEKFCCCEVLRQQMNSKGAMMEDRNQPVPRSCPHCGAAAKLMPRAGDYEIYVCPHCGYYRISGINQKLIANGVLDPKTTQIHQRKDGNRWLRRRQYHSYRCGRAALGS
jgi:hypothetical protein